MQSAANYCVVGMRPDGSVGIRLFSEHLGQAKVYASYIYWRHIDWDVRIEARESWQADMPQIFRAGAKPR